ncbi:sensor histidine kinase [Peribacillus saganii]|uniref:histidine kinase n=1 Tax=Peribacillus saganii TaxID=2303992 RepID=A0A372LMZ6_9BACI|nr:HAMP domain-containing sensor histidine kinase [Peribacillus saganii]RFU67901.1 sensor histidine kinase [Peribacillus saganii]
MEFQYDKILLQMLMVLFPIILYLALAKEPRGEKRERTLWGIVCAATMVLSISVAIKIDNGIFLDLRMVPWFLAFIYGGTGTGILVTLFFFGARFLAGGSGMIPAFIVMIISSLVVYKLQDKFQTWTPKKRITVSIIFLIVSSSMLPLIGSILLHESITLMKLAIYIFFVIENGIMAWFAVYLMESHHEKRQLIKEVQKNEKLNVVGQLAASVAHEIRNPMTSVRGFIQLLTTSENISVSEKDYLKVCLAELDRANDIISDYLSLGTNQSSEQFRKLDINKEAEKSIKSLSSYAMFHGVNVSSEIQENAHIVGISGRVQQMFINLIKNAIEAAAPHGHVTVKIHTEREKVIIRISDDGIGMDEQQIENLGLPYYSTKDRGTGLGLMVTLQIIRDMGGEFKVKSEKGTGTVFEIILPLVQPNQNSV